MFNKASLVSQSTAVFNCYWRYIWSKYLVNTPVLFVSGKFFRNTINGCKEHSLKCKEQLSGLATHDNWELLALLRVERRGLSLAEDVSLGRGGHSERGSQAKRGRAPNYLNYMMPKKLLFLNIFLSTNIWSTQPLSVPNKLRSPLPSNISYFSSALYHSMVYPTTF